MRSCLGIAILAGSNASLSSEGQVDRGTVKACIQIILYSNVQLAEDPERLTELIMCTFSTDRRQSQKGRRMQTVN